MIYLGTLGRMVGIKCPATQQVSSEERYTFETTLEGKRTAQVKQLGPRVWSLQTSDATTAADQSILLQFEQGAWGPGPFAFVSAEAQYTNLLVPRGANSMESQTMAGVSQGGPVNLGADGWSAQSLVAADPMVQTELYGARPYTPVLPGVKATGSAWISAGAASQAFVRLYWRDAQNAIIGTSASRGVSHSEGMVRVSVTALPPVGAVAVQIVSLWAERMTRPAITWTDQIAPWSVGNGCAKAVVHGASSDLKLTGPNRTYGNLSFTVSEVG